MVRIEPTTERGRTARARIISAGVDLVAEKGVAGLSLDDVGARSGASRSQLYHYFDDREDLIRAVVDSIIDSVIGSQDALYPHLNTWDGISRWLDDFVVAQTRVHGVGGCPIGTLAGQLAERDPMVRAALAAAFDRWQGYLRDGLAAMIPEEVDRDTDLDRLATATMALIQGGLLLTQVHRDPARMQIAVDAARQLLHGAQATTSA